MPLSESTQSIQTCAINMTPSPAQKHNVKEQTQIFISFEPKFIIFVLIESLYNPKYNS